MWPGGGHANRHDKMVGRVHVCKRAICELCSFLLLLRYLVCCLIVWPTCVLDLNQLSFFVRD